MENIKQKLKTKFGEKLKNKSDGKLILVTAITPTPAGEGKTCTSIGIAQAFGKLGVKHALAIREPSMGPTFGIKGGAAGGGYSQVLPMEDINIHFTGDLHAISAAHNLLSAVLDNSIHFDNPLNIDINKVTWRRTIDLCDRQLRNGEIGLGSKFDGFPHKTGFDIVAASEIMTIMALAEDISDLRDRLGRIVVAYSTSGKPIFAKELDCIGALCVILKDALKPNLVQTCEHTPVFVHCGPFGNIAHGSNSVRATRLALKLAPYVVTEAGFAADLGAEKFVNIKCRQAGLKPNGAVLVATVRALKFHGGEEKEN
jgi:Formyltetrahydrofolate synthetase